MMLAFEGTKRLDSDFEKGAVNVIEGEEADEGTERRAVRRKRPIGDQIKLGFGGTVAVRSDVMANVFNTVGEELAFLELKSNTVLHEHIANTFKQTKQSSKEGGP